MLNHKNVLFIFNILGIFNFLKMDNTNIEKLLEEIKANGKGNNIPVIVMQCITLGILVLKPILMYWIQAKYKADPPHESIRKFNGKDPSGEDSINNNIDSYESVYNEYNKNNMV